MDGSALWRVHGGCGFPTRPLLVRLPIEEPVKMHVQGSLIKRFTMALFPHRGISLGAVEVWWLSCQ